VYEKDPPLTVVQRFVHLLDTSDADYNEEMGESLTHGVLKELLLNIINYYSNTISMYKLPT